jgi:hypothetical protein
MCDKSPVGSSLSGNLLKLEFKFCAKDLRVKIQIGQLELRYRTETIVYTDDRPIT